MAKNGYSGLCRQVRSLAQHRCPRQYQHVRPRWCILRGRRRQDYIGADYGMLDCATGAPLPDYYTALLWARTMGPAVLGVAASAVAAGGGVVPVPAETSAIRVYAHCTTKGARTAAGSVTVLTINLGGTPTALHLPAAALVAVEEYVLTPSPAAAGSLSGVGGLMGTGPLSRFRPPGIVLGAQEILAI